MMHRRTTLNSRLLPTASLPLCLTLYHSFFLLAKTSPRPRASVSLPHIHYHYHSFFLLAKTLPRPRACGTLHGHGGRVNAVSFLKNRPTQPDSTAVLASAAADGSVRVWSLLAREGSVEATCDAAMLTGHTDSVVALTDAVLHAGARLLVSLGADHTARIWLNEGVLCVAENLLGLRL